MFVYLSIRAEYNNFCWFANVWYLFAVVPHPVPYDELPVRLHVRLDDLAAAQAAHGSGCGADRPPLAVRAAPRAAAAAAAATQQ